MADTKHLHAIDEAIDNAIAFDHQMYLKATFAGHDGEARYYALEVDQLQNIRDLVHRTPPSGG